MWLHSHFRPLHLFFVPILIANPIYTCNRPLPVCSPVRKHRCLLIRSTRMRRKGRTIACKWSSPLIFFGLYMHTHTHAQTVRFLAPNTHTQTHTDIFVNSEETLPFFFFIKKKKEKSLSLPCFFFCSC